MAAVGSTSAPGETLARKPGRLTRWWRSRGAGRRKVDRAVWELRERYGEAAYGIAQASARAPVGFERRRFWRKVAGKLRRLG